MSSDKKLIYSARMILAVVEAAQDWINDGKIDEAVVQLVLDSKADVVDAWVITNSDSVEAVKEARDETVAAVHRRIAKEAQEEYV